jgi:hypothetical protein
MFTHLLIGLCALLTGLAKTGLPGLGVLVVPLMAMAVPPRESTGMLLPMLLVGDVFAVTYYHRHAVWSHLWRLLPWAFVGIVIGWLALGRVNDTQLRLFVGVVVLALLALTWVRDRTAALEHLPHALWFGAVLGLLAGITTMMANAAGPIMVAYLLAMRLPKNEFIGTGAWFFLIVNAVKVPFSIHLHLIRLDSLWINLFCVPLILLGCWLGLKLLRRIPEKLFARLVQALAAIAAVKLLWG